MVVFKCSVYSVNTLFSSLKTLSCVTLKYILGTYQSPLKKFPKTNLLVEQNYTALTNAVFLEMLFKIDFSGIAIVSLF